MMQTFLQGDATFDGIFLTAVRTTGVFCQPTCPAKKPRPENVSFYGTSREALQSGYRPCKRCRPLEAAGEYARLVASFVGRPRAGSELPSTVATTLCPVSRRHSPLLRRQSHAPRGC